jgi:hypothetical protein
MASQPGGYLPGFGEKAAAIRAAGMTDAAKILAGGMTDAAKIGASGMQQLGVEAAKIGASGMQQLGVEAAKIGASGMQQFGVEAAMIAAGSMQQLGEAAKIGVRGFVWIGGFAVLVALAFAVVAVHRGEFLILWSQMHAVLASRCEPFNSAVP